MFFIFSFILFKKFKNRAKTDLIRGKIKFPLNCMKLNLDNLESTQSYNMNNANKLGSLFNKYFNKSIIDDKIRSALFLFDSEYYEKCGKLWSYNLDLHKRRLLLDIDQLKSQFFCKDSGLYEMLRFCLDKNCDVDDICNNAAKYVGLKERYNDLADWKQILVKNSNLLTKHCSKHYIG